MPNSSILRVQNHINSLFNSVSYRLGETIVDPGDKWMFEGVQVALLTHAHFDHIYGLNELLEDSPATKVFTNEHGRVMLMNARKNMSFYNGSPFVFEHPENIVVVSNGEEVVLGNGVVARAFFTPGHNPSCITWMVGDAVFSGDALIPGIKTVTNLPGGDMEAARQSEKVIWNLAEGKSIFPGHPVS